MTFLMLFFPAFGHLGTPVHCKTREKRKMTYRPCFTPDQQFARVTSIGSLPPKTLKKNPRTPAEPRRDPAEPSERPRGALGETPAEPSERQISSYSLAEGCAPRMVTLRNFRIQPPPPPAQGGGRLGACHLWGESGRAKGAAKVRRLFQGEYA